MTDAFDTDELRIKWAIDAFRDGRNDRYDKLQRYIQGDHPLMFATPKYESAFGKRFAPFNYNRCEMAVDAHTDRMRVTGFDSNDPAISQKAIDLWNLNRMHERDNYLFGDAFGLGDGYLIVEKSPHTGKVNMWVNTPQTMRVHWSETDPDTIDLAAKVWYDDEKYCYLTIYTPGEVEKYISKQRAPSGMPRSHTAFERREVAGEPWPLKLDVPDEVPVFHIANNGRANSYGVSELRSVVPLQDALNKTVTDMIVAMEFAAFPQRVLMGVDVPQTDEEKALVAAFESGLTRVWTMSDPTAKIGEFSAANIMQYIAVAEYFDKSVSRVTKIPVHWLGMTTEIESGRARQVAEAAFVAKIKDRQRSYGHTLADAASYGLRLDGMAVAPGDIAVEWESAESSTEQDELDKMLAKQSLGFALETIMRQEGYSPDDITTILEEKRRAEDEAMRAFSRGYEQEVA